MKNFDVTIIGAGIISLSTAYYLSRNKLKVVIIENKNQICLGNSNSLSNSGVIHAGIYYPANSLKSKFCLRGKNLIYNFCKKNKIRHNNCGKIIFTDSIKNIDSLNKCLKQARSNNLHDLQILDSKNIKKLEPNLKAYAGIFSPSSGILDVKQYIETLQKLIKKNDVKIFTSFNFVAEKKLNDWELTNINNNYKIRTNLIINSAGLNASNISKMYIGDKNTPISSPSLGYYLRYKKKFYVNRILYSSIEPGLIKERFDMTPSINGDILIGPSIEKEKFSKINSNNYRKILKRILPKLNQHYNRFDPSKLELYSSGVRAKIILNNKIHNDFYFKFYGKHNWLDLLGIDSPGITASLAIAEYVDEIIKKNYKKLN